MLQTLMQTQRSTDQLIPPAPEIDKNSFSSEPPPYYSSPSDRPTTEQCQDSSCGKMSGTVNNLQIQWMKSCQETYLADSTTSIPIRTDPPIPKLSQEPELSSYLLKPFFMVHPERQFGVVISGERCPSCETGVLKFKQFSAPRHCQGLATDMYAVFARYSECDHSNHFADEFPDINVELAAKQRLHFGMN